MLLYAGLAVGALIVISIVIGVLQELRPRKGPRPETNLRGMPAVVPPLPPIRKAPAKLELHEET